jgi:hypothetical protein
VNRVRDIDGLIDISDMDIFPLFFAIHLSNLLINGNATLCSEELFYIATHGEDVSRLRNDHYNMQNTEFVVSIHHINTEI